MIVQCPRCRKRWRIQDTGVGITCDCHLYCSSGDKPLDCSVTSAITGTLQLGWPAGSHGADVQEGDDVRHRVRYCSTHDKYIDKVPLFLEFDRESYVKQRLPKHLTTFPK